MLVSVDIEKGTVSLIDRTITTLSLADLNRLQALLHGKMVDYVSEVTQTSGDDLMVMLAELCMDPSVVKAPITQTAPVQSRSGVPAAPVETDNRRWMYATGSGYMNVPAAKLRFDGPADFKDYDRMGGEECMEMYPILKELRTKGKVKIVGTNEMNRLKKVAAAAQAKREAMMMKNSDGTDIIVDTVGGRIRNKPMDDLFTDVTLDEPAPMSEEQRLIEQYGFGKAEEGDGPQLEVEV